MRIESYKSSDCLYIPKFCAYFAKVLKETFRFRMLKHLLPIASSAFMGVMYESVAYTFIFSKVLELPDQDFHSLTFFVMVPFIGI
jgi:hypothetical protein